jgi:uncharacterized Zn finger protein
MSRQHKTESASSESNSAAKWASLTWDDLDDWAGARSVSRGRTYQRQERVKQLAISEDGRLLATVMGGNRYIVSVWMTGKKNDPIESKCTCPVGYDGCKHAVAVVAEYLERLSGEEEIRTASADDPLWDQLEGTGEDFDEGELDDEEEDDQTPTARKSSRRSRDDWDEKIKQHIFAKSREDLSELVWSLTQRFDELRDEFRERIALGEGDVDRLIAQARKELNHITSQEPWRNSWTGEGNIPDYSKLLHRLERLVELGHADAVARLGREIIERGMEQVGQSHDEGDTAMELSRCLPVVFDAVAKSSLTPAQKLLFAVDAELQDDYDVIGDASDAVFNGKYQPSDWSAVADDLAKRLSSIGTKRRKSLDDDDEDDDGDDYSRDYQRDQISNWLVDALKRAGRGEEVLAILEKESRKTGSYERLVKHLIEHKHFDDAKRWATEGITKTASNSPGIAANLAKRLCELAAAQKQWDAVAAHAAYEFFDRPSREGFKHLMQAAAMADCEESVHRVAHRFLETGVAPIQADTAKKGETHVRASKDWPLPVPEYLIPMLQSDYRMRGAVEPYYGVLIDMAIADKRPNDVLHWYDKMCDERKRSAYGDPFGAHADAVAETVARSHPQRTLEIYRQRVEQNLKHTGNSAYESVASYLRKMRPVMKSIDRENDWKQLVEDIQIRYRNRPKLMEILDRLERKPILAMRKTRR